MVASSLTCGTVGPLQAPAPRADLPSRRLVLPSGLTVYVEEETESPVAGVVWTVRCGSAQDPPGREGLAHAVEHMVFRAPAGTGVERHERLVRLGAAEMNGETGWDQTRYHTFVHANAAGALLDLEAAAMADPLAGIDEASFAVEMGVVREELSYHDLPGDQRAARAALEKEIFPARHPYAHAVGGTPASLAAITLADARAFAAGCYQPRNMAIVLAGSIPAGWPDGFIARLPPRLRGDPAHAIPARLPPAPAGGVYPSPPAIVTEVKAPVAAGEVWVGWALPPAVGADASARAVLARLVRGLMQGGLENEGDADNPHLDSGQVSVGTPSGQLGGMLICRARLPPDAKPAAEADAIIEHVSTLWRRLNESQAWFERVRVRAVADVALDESDVVYRAQHLAQLLASNPGGRPSDAQARVAAVNYAEALGWARNFLGRAQARVVVLRPSYARRDVAATAALRTGHHSFDVAPPASIPTGQRVSQVARPLGAARAVSRRLANGLTVTVLRRPGAMLTDLVLGFHAAPDADDDPAVPFAFTLAWERHYFRSPSQLAISHDLHFEADALSERIEVLAGHESEAIDYLGRVIGVLSIEWPSDRFQRWATLRRTEENLPTARAARNLSRALWRGHVYGEPVLVHDVEEVETADLEQWLASVRRPSNGTLIIVGDVAPEQIFARVDQTVGTWGKPDAIANPLPQPPAAPVTGSLRLLTHRVAGRAAGELKLGCLLPPVQDEGQRTSNRLLARWLNDRLRDALRTSAGASYAPHAGAAGLRGGAAILRARADVETSALPLAVATIRTLLATSAFDTATLDRLRWAEARESNLRHRTPRSLADALFDRWNMGWELATLDELPARLEAVTAGDLEAALRVCRASAVLTVVGETNGIDGGAKGE